MDKPVTISRSRRGFTMVEMVVVIGIIILIATLLLPMITRAYRSGMRARMAADLGVLQQALEAYKTDHHAYPQFDYFNANTNVNANFFKEPNRGAILLCWALMGPGDANQDGADGLGFRTRGKRGQVYGPYIQPDRFKVTPVTAFPQKLYPDSVLLDRRGHVIMYMPANTHADITAKDGYIAEWDPTSGKPQPMFNALDVNLDNKPGDPDPKVADGFSHVDSDPNMALKRLKAMMGDKDFDGGIETAEGESAYNGPYILWSPGPDEIYGPKDTKAQEGDDKLFLSTIPACDDVTSFNHQ